MARDGDAIVLAGHVPSDEDRAALLSAARELDGVGEVSDRMQVAVGLPADVSFRTLADFALRQIVQLRDGSLEFEDGRISLRGRALDREALVELETAFRADRPAGTRAGDLAVSAGPVMPYLFSAERGGGRLVLSGHVPDPKLRADLLGEARQRFFGDVVVDRLRIGDGAPPGFAAMVGSGLEQLSFLAEGELVVRDAGLRLAGEALYRQSAERIRARLQAAAAGWTLVAEVTPKDSAALGLENGCHDLLARRLAGERLSFGSGAKLSRASSALLDDLARAARDCPQALIRLVVQDAAGPDLRAERLLVIRERLLSAGIAAGRISTEAPRDPAEHTGSVGAQRVVRIVAR